MGSEVARGLRAARTLAAATGPALAGGVPAFRGLTTTRPEDGFLGESELVRANGGIPAARGEVAGEPFGDDALKALASEGFVMPI